MRLLSELRNSSQEIARFKVRLGVGIGFVLLIFSLLLLRMVHLQVVQYKHYQTLAENNRITLVPTPPNRGSIYARGGEVLAQNFSGYTLEITPSRIKDVDATIDALAELIEITPRDRRRFQRLREEVKSFESLPIRSRLTEEEVARFAVNRYRFPGVEIRARLFRDYPYRETFSHLVGYIGRINDRDLERLEADGTLVNYKGTDHIGKTGVEQSYEALLHGTTGAERVETDAGGRAVRTLGRTPPAAGANLILGVDARLQQIASDAFGDYRGALVALDPKTGEVLAFVSKPGYDTNLFVDGIDSANWDALNKSPDHPLTNRALRGTYPPGSTFKPFMMLAGLELNAPVARQTIADPGYFSLPGQSHQYRDWKKGGHGSVDIIKSMIVSCDTFYYIMANQLGVDNIARFIGQFGLGKKTGIDLVGEAAGVLPTQAWKRKRFKQRWFPGETVITGIGQGYNLTTPLQLAAATAMIANDGVMMRPRVVSAVQRPDGSVERLQPEVAYRAEFKPEHLDMLRRGMIGVTQPGGTATLVGANAPYQVAGKTGTAQVIGIKQGQKYDESRINVRHRDHALFVAYAPAQDPKIALAVVVENGSHGGSTAGPIARKVFDYYLLKKEPAAKALPAPAADPAPAPDDHGHD